MLLLQLGCVTLENQELSEAQIRLQNEVAKLNGKLKAKKAEMTNLHISYESAFEEKMTHMQEYVQKLERRLRDHSRAMFAAHSSPDNSAPIHRTSPIIATAVSPQGTYTLKSSLTFNGDPDEDLPEGFARVRGAPAETRRQSDDQRLNLRVHANKNDEMLEAGYGGTGQVPQVAAREQWGAEGDMDLVAEIQLSAIANMSAASLILSPTRFGSR